ncbi:hypothetical protein KSF_087470 [Reticulibacter mediterranei]|uniref:Uncharacterized protein n=1 Tax=Reticulibacter mediterranei TaxID=2778369 RepID=A0A8J3IN61_9CHLR|nr:hypothetical protein [Reticulibacter mediterranei]GHO98699.1 hypothetical protein KSF_087470 [Reticulibacter mediterranei]
MALKPVHTPAEGMVVVCFDRPTEQVRVGRIQRLQRTAKGLEVDLLYADQHLQAGDLIWSTYFYRKRDAPAHSGIFEWPGDLTLTFDLAKRSLTSRPGWLVNLVVEKSS